MEILQGGFPSRIHAPGSTFWSTGTWALQRAIPTQENDRATARERLSKTQWRAMRRQRPLLRRSRFNLYSKFKQVRIRILQPF